MTGTGDRHQMESVIGFAGIRNMQDPLICQSQPQIDSTHKLHPNRRWRNVLADSSCRSISYALLPRPTPVINEWAEDPDELEVKRYLSLIEEIGKGRFAQRPAGRLEDVEQPSYIGAAINFVADRV